jgi:NADH-quinone oxidoreductase subunit L
MMAAMSVGGYSAGIFHLFTHAFFKALLFLAAGAIIHAVHSNNMSEMGGLARAMPVTFVTFLVGALALTGIAPLAGFWSKDEILTDAWTAGFAGAGEAATSQSVAQIVFVTGMVTAFLTALYVGRMLWLTFGAAFRGQGHPHEADAAMLFPLVVLALGAVLAGFVGLGDNSIATWIQTEALPAHGPVTLNLGLMAATTVIALAGLALGTALYRRGLPEREYLERVPLVWKTLQRRYFLDDLYEQGIVRAVAGALAPATYWFDQRVIDGVVDGAGLGTGRLARGLRYVQSGQVQWYAAALFLGVVGLAVVVTQLIGS